jgi:hypothetical protein
LFSLPLSLQLAGAVQADPITLLAPLTLLPERPPLEVIPTRTMERPIPVPLVL